MTATPSPGSRVTAYALAGLAAMMLCAACSVELPDVSCFGDDDCASAQRCASGACVSADADIQDADGGEVDGDDADASVDVADAPREDADAAPAMSPWTVEPTELALDGVGGSIALSGTRAAVGLPTTDGQVEDQGAVVTWQWSEDEGWSVDTTLQLSAPTTGAGFGASVSLDADRLVVGSPGLASDQGRAWVYARGPDGWALTGPASDPDLAGVSRFGERVALHDTVLVVERGLADDGRVALWEGFRVFQPYRALDLDAPSGPAIPAVRHGRVVAGFPTSSVRATEAGDVRTWEKVDGHWIEDEPPALDVAAADRAGCAVALDASTLVVGVCGAGMDDAGRVDVFARSDGRWVFDASLTPADAAAGDEFGRAVAVDGDTIVVGDRRGLTAWEREGPRWVQTGDRLIAETPVADVALSAGRVLILRDDGAVLAGARCPWPHHGPACEARCDDGARNGDELDVDWGGACPAPTPEIVWAFSPENSGSLADRFVVTDAGQGDGVDIVAALVDDPAFYTHDRWIAHRWPNTLEQGAARVHLTPLDAALPQPGFELLLEVTAVPRDDGFAFAEAALVLSGGSGTAEWRVGAQYRANVEPAFVVASGNGIVASAAPSEMSLGIPVIGRLQVVADRARLKVWPAIFPEPESGWVDVPNDGAQRTLWSLSSDIRAGMESRIGSVVVRRLHAFDDQPVTWWFPPEADRGADVDHTAAACESRDTFLETCNANTAPGYYWEQVERIGDYGFAGIVRSPLRPPCDQARLGTMAQASAWEIMLVDPAEYVCRGPNEGDAEAWQCPGVDGDIFEAGRERNGIFTVRCRAR